MIEETGDSLAPYTDRTCSLVLIGASAGAVYALSTVLPLLKENFSIPIVIVVHIPADRESAIVDVFQRNCKLKVMEAEDKVPLEAGTVYFAPPDYHVLVEPDCRLSLSSEEPVLFSRPSIDVLFESAAVLSADRVVGVILTGGNSDGATGLKMLIEGHGRGLIQDPAEAQASAMPLAAIQLCPTAKVLSLVEIAAELNGLKSDL